MPNRALASLVLLLVLTAFAPLAVAADGCEECASGAAAAGCCPPACGACTCCGQSAPLADACRLAAPGAADHAWLPVAARPAVPASCSVFHVPKPA